MKNCPQCGLTPEAAPAGAATRPGKSKLKDQAQPYAEAAMGQLEALYTNLRTTRFLHNGSGGDNLPELDQAMKAVETAGKTLAKAMGRSFQVRR